jgi:F420-dependent oxidoreductase-like protein
MEPMLAAAAEGTFVRHNPAVRLALMIEGQEGVRWEQWLSLARACEENGIETLFRSDHYLSLERPLEHEALDAWTTIAGLAASTSRLRLGTLVSPVTFRHPSLLAKSAATADLISSGRIELGMGAGWMEREHKAYGFPFPDLRTRLELLGEQVEVVHRLWTEERVTFHGRHYELEDCPALPKPAQQPHPPLIIGGKGGSGTVGPAVRFADEYNTFGAGAGDCAALRGRLDEACERAGRDPATLPLSLMTPVRYERANEEAVEALEELAEAGVERVMLQHLRHDDLETVAMIGTELAPAVR